MAIRKVAVLGHPILRKLASPIAPEDIKTERIQTLIRDMIETMVEYDGLGLAAPQVYESVQLVILMWDFDPQQKPSLRCLINPVLKTLTEDTSSHWEGCLSVPGLRGRVTRKNKVSVEAFDQHGKKLSFTAEGFAATVIQHECDHLIGKLYLDRMDDLSQLAFNREYDRYLSSPDDTEPSE